jgi:hypothetical protein
MALPQQVIDRLSREPSKTPGWSFGVFTFSGGIFFLAILVYCGLIFGYEPYIDSQIAQLGTQIGTLAKAISPDDQARLVTFYSEISNLKTALTSHVALSRFLTWLQNNTEANVYYSRFQFSSGNQVVLTGIAKTEADVNQQVAIFEADPAVKSMNISTVSFSDSNRLWQFAVTLTMDPAAVILASP